MTTLNRLDQLLHTAERGRPLDVDSQGRVPVRLYGPDGQPLFTESNPAHVKGEVTLTGQIRETLLTSDLTLDGGAGDWAGGVVDLLQPSFAISVTTTASHLFDIHVQFYDEEGTPILSFLENHVGRMRDTRYVTDVMPSRGAKVRVRITNLSPTPKTYAVKVHHIAGLATGKANSAHRYLSTNATTTLQDTLVRVKHVVFLANDGDDDITFTFDGDFENEFVLKPGECLNDVPLTVQRLYYRAASGEQPFRFMGVL